MAGLFVYLLIFLINLAENLRRRRIYFPFVDDDAAKSQPATPPGRVIVNERKTKNGAIVPYEARYEDGLISQDKIR